MKNFVKMKKSDKELFKQLKSYVKWVAHSYYELSHDKVAYQYNAFIKEAKKLEKQIIASGPAV